MPTPTPTSTTLDELVAACRAALDLLARAEGAPLDPDDALAVEDQLIAAIELATGEPARPEWEG